MGIAVLLFGIIVGVFHYTGDAPAQEPAQTYSAAPQEPAGFREESQLAEIAPVGPAREQRAAVQATPAAQPVHEAPATPYAALVGADNIEQLAQSVADLVAEKPGSASSVVTIALAQVYEKSTLGDVALLAASATKAAPEQAPAIAGAVTRSLHGQSDPALAASVATIISLVPEQSRDIGLVVGAIVGDDRETLGMVAQTVAIAVGQETFSSLSEGSGISMATLMKESSSLGIAVPFDVPNYAAQLAPNASMVADSAGQEPSPGDM